MAAISPLFNDSLEPAELYGRWEGVLHDRALRDLPYRIEINKWGHLEMTPPATPHHMRIGTRLARLLNQRLGGEAFTECAILTSGGVRIGPVCRGPVAVEYLWRVARAHRVVLGRGGTGSVDPTPHGPRGLLRGRGPPDHIAHRARLDSIDPGYRGRGQRSQALTHGAFQTLDHPLDLLVREVVVKGQCQRAAG